MQLINVIRRPTMLSKQILLILIVLSVTNVAQNQPFDLLDQVTKQLEELKAIVTGEIIAAHNSLQALLSLFGRNSAVIANNAIVNLQQEHSTILAQLQAIKDLAYSAGKNPSPCTSAPEATISTLPTQYTQRITECISEVNDQARNILDSSTYIIDISFSTVTHLEQQVAQCNGNLLCISPILTQIELNKSKIPQNIKLEVQAADSSFTTLKLSTQSCRDDNLSRYTSLVNVLIEDVADCVNRLIG